MLSYRWFVVTLFVLVVSCSVPESASVQPGSTGSVDEVSPSSQALADDERDLSVDLEKVKQRAIVAVQESAALTGLRYSDESASCILEGRSEYFRVPGDFYEAVANDDDSYFRDRPTAKFNTADILNCLTEDDWVFNVRVMSSLDEPPSEARLRCILEETGGVQEATQFFVDQAYVTETSDLCSQVET